LRWERKKVNKSFSSPFFIVCSKQHENFFNPENDAAERENDDPALHQFIDLFL
jgi:hypothetical protein